MYALRSGCEVWCVATPYLRHRVNMSAYREGGGERRCLIGV